ncbi:MAG TPA: GDSL-type esterase/lipase family protein [Vicinamibacterales bacterium]|nr:GDSL-type esterase/lipase family protein [Vicinamibacterales bacterium]
MRRFGLSLAALALLSACGGPPQGPTPPPVGELSLACPINQSVEVVGTNVTVDYPPPQPTGGAPPVTVVCTPASGTEFPLGQTSVNCTATDNAGRSAVCGFAVQVTQIPVIGATAFLAFGDSLTNGEVSLNAQVLVVDRTVAYPTVLAERLQARYKSQTITVVNAGVSGESAEKGEDRLPDEIDRHHPEVLLLLQGVIDLTQHGEAGIQIVTDALRNDIRNARAQGVEHIFLSTLLPQKPGSNSQAMPFIKEMNDVIEELARRENVHLVDGYGAIAGHEATLVGRDGLHLTPEGYEALAGAFFDAIVVALETPPSAASRQRRRR